MVFSHSNSITKERANETPGHDSEACFAVSFPQRKYPESVHQDEEFAEVTIGGKIQKIRIHDYQIMFAYPGLYEYIVHEQLECDSPRVLVQLLKQHLSSGIDSLPNGPLAILDVAAGNGIVGSELRKQLGENPGIGTLVGIDLLQSARTATLRDRPDIYDQFLVADLIQPDERYLTQLKRFTFNVVTICAALGPGKDDLPLEAFDSAIDFLSVGGLLLFTVNEANRRPSDPARWTIFLDGIRDGRGTHRKDMIQIEKQRYNHRKTVQGEWIDYSALIYRRIDVGRSPGGMT